MLNMDKKTNMLHENSQNKMTKYFQILFIWNVLKRQIYKHRKQVSGCLELGPGPTLQAGTGKLGGSGEMYSIVGLGDGCPTFHIYW